MNIKVLGSLRMSLPEDACKYHEVDEWKNATGPHLLATLLRLQHHEHLGRGREAPLPLLGRRPRMGMMLCNVQASLDVTN